MGTLEYKEITSEVIGEFLNGRDPQEKIVNLTYSYKDDFIKVYYRNENDDKCVSDEPFYPFLWATHSACLRLCNGDRKKVRELLNKYNIGIKKLRTTTNDGTEPEEMKNGYKFMFYAMSPMSYSRFLDFFKKADNPVYADKKNGEVQKPKSEEKQYISVTPQEQYLISTGKRFFKGYDDYDNILRMAFDLETTGLDTHKDRIIQFGIRFNRPVKLPRTNEYHTFEKIFTVEGNTEEELRASELNAIKTALKVIYTFRPDVITAHNGENFDWNVIINACERLGTSMEELCKPYGEFFNGQFIKKNDRDSILKLGGEIETFKQTIVPGIIVTDSLHAVRRAQATDSNFLQATLKYATKYLGLKKENRVYTPGNEISKIWNDLEEHYAFNDKDGDWYLYDENSKNGKTDKFTPGKVEDKSFVMYTRNYIADGYELKSGRYIIERYLLDDLWECDKVEKTLNGTDFMMCKIIPVTFQKCCTMGTASQWKAIMMAWSYENDLAIPLSPNTGSFTGGLSRLLKVGYVDNVVKLDYNSLYPSIILTWAISDDNDLMSAMLYMLEYVLTTREKYKKVKKAADKECDSYKELIKEGNILTPEQKKLYDNAIQRFMINDNAQMLWKKLGNSYFGSYGSNNGGVFPWKSPACAERTTCTGRQSLRLMISHFHDLGYQPIVGDSVTGDTPLFIKYKDNGLIDIKPISEIVDEQNVEKDSLGREYDYSNKNYLVLCRSGWSEINYVYRHQTDKDIYNVKDGEMEVECTQDHSLFDNNRKEIKPYEITDSTKLEYYTEELVHSYSDEIQDNELLLIAKKLANGKIDRIPVNVLNSSTINKRKFFSFFMQNKKEYVNYTKTCRAGLNFLVK